MERLQGKVALVTGAARGQGRSHALRLAQEGADIIAVDICSQLPTVPYDMSNEGDLEETVRLVEGEDRRIVPAVLDIRDQEALGGFVDSAVAELGGLDIVVANAGITTLGGVRETTMEAFRETMDVNVTGVFSTAKSTVEHLIDRGGGSFIATSSVYGLKGAMGIIHYTASKHAVTGLVRSMAHELAPFHIRVNSVHPTTVATDMILNDALFKHFRPDLEAPTIADAEEGFQSINVLPVVMIEPSDVSNAIAFLASDEAKYLTGVALPVDAGSTQQ